MRRSRSGVASALLVVLALLTSGCSTEKSALPDVVGQALDDAHNILKADGFEKFDDKDDFGDRRILLDANWVVVAQDPAAGTPTELGQTITLRVGKIGESNAMSRLPASSPVLQAARSAQPETTPSPASAADDASDATPLTVANSPELAVILGVDDYCDERLAPFADKYAGRLLAFDGSVASLAARGSSSTRYDVLVAAGDMGATFVSGPAFKFEDTGIAELKLQGTDTVREGDLFLFTARIDRYNQTQCLFFLEPVTTRAR